MKSSCCHSKKIFREKEFIKCTNPHCQNYLLPTIPHITRTWNNIFLFFFFIFLFILSFNDFSYDTPGLKTHDLCNSELSTPKELSKDNLKKVLDHNNVICPEQVYAQIMIESGNLKSFLTKKTNNLLGMRYPFKRKTSAIGIYLPDSNQIIKGTQAQLKKYSKHNHYAVYDSWEDCIIDYKFWQDKSFKLTEKYLVFLGNYYAEDTLYISKIKSISKKD